MTEKRGCLVKTFLFSGEIFLWIRVPTPATPLRALGNLNLGNLGFWTNEGSFSLGKLSSLDPRETYINEPQVLA